MSNPTNPTPKPPNRVRVAWEGGHRFDAGRPGGPSVRLDASGETGPSPVDAVLSALATCTSVDVVEIMEKRRTPLSDLAVDVVGYRVGSTPRRLERVRLAYSLDGPKLDRAHAERAVELAITKYCSVRDSLAPDIVIEYEVTVNDEPGEWHTTEPAPRGASAAV